MYLTKGGIQLANKQIFNILGRYSVFMNRKMQCCQGVSSSLSDLQIQCNLTQILTNYSLQYDKLILKFIGRCKRSSTVNIILKKKCKVRGLTLSNFMTYYKVRMIKIVAKQQTTDQWNRMESQK